MTTDITLKNPHPEIPLLPHHFRLIGVVYQRPLIMAEHSRALAVFRFANSPIRRQKAANPLLCRSCRCMRIFVDWGIKPEDILYSPLIFDGS